LIIELVEGPTLADRIAAGPIPVDEALAIAGQIADALESAHGQGIVHRDLKPANIKLRDDGTVKVLDFGIAKAIETRTTGLEAPALTSPAQTAAGIVLGTAAYMAPEQARGKPLDQRADIWAFGCILYEMLSGQPTFAGEDRTSTLARVLEREPDTGALPRGLAPSVARTIRLCLEKDPRRRVADIRDARLALEGTFDSDVPGSTGVNTRRPSWFWGAAASFVSAVVVGALAVWLTQSLLRPPPGAAPPVARLAVSLPAAAGYLGLDLLRGGGAVSPDGRHVAIVGWKGTSGSAEPELWLWTMNSLDPRPLAGTEGGTSPFWSQDGRSIAFTANGLLKRIEIAGGGSAVSIPNARPRPTVAYGTWSLGGTILYANPDGGLSRIRPDGSQAATVTEGSLAIHHEIPVFLPDQRHFLYFLHDSASGAASLAAGAGIEFRDAENRRPTGIYLGDIDQAPDAQPYTLLVRADDGPAFVSRPGERFGYVLYVRDQALMARRFDIDALGLADDEEIFLHSPIGASFASRGTRMFTASSDGRVILSEPVGGDSRLLDLASEAGQEALTWVSRGGSVEALDLAPETFGKIVISTDGIRFAAGFAGGLWLSAIDRPGWTRLSLVQAGALLQDWSPDGERILFTRPIDDGTAVYSVSASRNDDPAMLVQLEGTAGSVLWLDEDSLIYTKDHRIRFQQPPGRVRGTQSRRPHEHPSHRPCGRRAGNHADRRQGRRYRGLPRRFPRRQSHRLSVERIRPA
jgi:hypothetical protein